MERLVLFDMDSTLVKGFGPHALAFSEGVKKVYNVDAEPSDFGGYSGYTDQQILYEALQKKGLDKETIKSGLEDCMEAMVDSFNKNIENEEIIVLDGVPELIKELYKRNVLLGLVTGNLKPIAYGKLRKIGLEQCFKVGGFGSDDMYRANLVRIAIIRAQDNYNFRFNNNVYVCGDTPKDIEAGQEAGVKTIGVATGKFSKEELENAGADYVFKNLKERDRFLEIILKQSC